MQNIFRLLQKFQVVLLFLLFQFLCLILLLSGDNQYHKSSIASSSNAVVGTIYDISNTVTSYFHLEKENKQLVEENNELKKQLLSRQIQVGKMFVRVNDSVFYQQYESIPSKVINSSISFPKNNFITLNVGQELSVNSNMAVIGTKGIVGVVIASSNSYSTVMPVINANFTLPVRHANSKSFGRIFWGEDDTYLTATVIDVPSNVAVDIGDMIETRGSDGMFPEGIPVGKVLSVTPVSGETYQIIKIGLIEDFSAIYNVKVIKNVKRNEQLELEKATQEKFQ